MKKIILVVVMGLLVSGCGVQPQNSGQSEEKKDVFTSIRDAINKQMVLKCDYKDEEGTTTTTYIKGQVVRMMGQSEGKNIDGLMKDNKFYLWSQGEKEGMVIDLATAEGMSMGDKPVKSVDDVVAVLEEKKEMCKLSPESAGLLELPSDVNFRSLDGFLK